MAKIGRNEPCPCGSGKKYKQCCLAKNEAAGSAPSVAAQAADHLPHHHPRFCKNCNANIDAAARGVLALIDAGKLDAAEQAARAMMMRWPDIHDGYDCFGMVCEARGNNRQAADYYRKVIAMARKDPSFYEDDFPEYYEKLKPPGYLKPNDEQVTILARYRRGRRWPRPVMRPGARVAPGRSPNNANPVDPQSANRPLVT